MTFSLNNHRIWRRNKFEPLFGGKTIAVKKSSLGIWRSERSFDLTTGDQLVVRHLEDSGVEDWLKPSGKRRVSRLFLDESRYIVKEYSTTMLPAFFRAACRSWVYSLYLEDFSPPCLGWLSTKKQGDFLIYRDAGTGNFWRGQYDHLPDILSLYEKCAELLGDLHQAGIYHTDTKPANFVRNQWISQSRREVLIVDCDHICLYRQIPWKYRAKNLAQFLAGTGYTGDFRIWCALISAFIDAYQLRTGLDQSEICRIMDEVGSLVTRQGIENNLKQLRQSTFDADLHRRMKYKIPIPWLVP